MEPSIGVADLHIHTSDGDGMASIAEILEHVASTDLSVIAITEHDDIRPSLVARELHAQGSYSFDLVCGMEVTTRSGHVLAVFVDRPVRSFQTTDRTIAEIHEAGGLALIPHPLSWLTRSVGERVMTRLLQDPETTPDGIEVSPSPAASLTRRRARALNASNWRLPEYGSSDAHFVTSIAGAVTEFPGRSAEDLRKAFRAETASAILRGVPSPCSLGWRTLLRQQWRGIWVTPRKIVGPYARRALGRASR